MAHAPALLITRIEVVGAKTVSDSALQKIAQDTLAGNHFFIYPKRHAWWYEPTKITSAIQAIYPQLAEVQITPLNQTALKLSVEERQGEYLFCLSEGVCYFMDEAGFVFAPAPVYSDHLFFEFNDGVKTGASPIGLTPFNLTDFKLLTTLHERLATMLRSVEAFHTARVYRVEKMTEHDYQFLIDWPTSPTRTSFVLRFKLAQNPAEVVSSLRSALESSAFTNDWQTAEGALQYLDLRFLPKVFYKFAPDSL